MRDAEIDIKTAVANMRPEYTHCRDYGHHWDSFQVYQAGRNYERVLRCTSCSTLCHQLIQIKGGRLVGGRRYTYPEDYLIVGIGYFSADDRGVVRLASIKDDMRKAS